MFENQLGDSIKVEIKALPEDTANLLEIVLSGDHEAAERLAAVIHRDVSFSEVNTIPIPHFEIDTTSLGIWIDPIGKGIITDFSSNKKKLRKKEAEYWSVVYYFFLQMLPLNI